MGDDEKEEETERKKTEPFSDNFKSFCQDQGNVKRGKQTDRRRAL